VRILATAVTDLANAQTLSKPGRTMTSQHLRHVVALTALLGERDSVAAGSARPAAGPFAAFDEPRRAIPIGGPRPLPSSAVGIVDAALEAFRVNPADTAHAGDHASVSERDQPVVKLPVDSGTFRPSPNVSC